MSAGRYLAALGPTTRAAYARDVATVARETSRTLDELLDELLDARRAPALVASWAGAARERQAPSTVRRKLAALRAVLAGARIVGDASHELPRVRLPRGGRRTYALEPADVARIILAARRSLPIDAAARLEVLARLGFELGLRVGEACGLDLDALDRAAFKLRVRRKGGRIAWLTLPGPTLAAVDAWLAARPACASRALLVTLHGVDRGERWTVRAARAALGTTSARALGRRIPPHALRHAGTTAALAATRGDVRAVARWAGHDDVRVTLAHYDDDVRDLGGAIAAELAAAVAVAPRQLTLGLDERAGLTNGPTSETEPPVRPPT